MIYTVLSSIYYPCEMHPIAKVTLIIQITDTDQWGSNVLNGVLTVIPFKLFICHFIVIVIVMLHSILLHIFLFKLLKHFTCPCVTILL